MIHKFTFRRILGLILFSVLAACGTYNTTTPTEAPFSTVAVSTPTIPSPTMTLSPVPTRLIVPLVTPDEIQVARWKEYEAILAKGLGFLPEETLCEWDILETSEQVLYIWAVCENKIPFGTTNTGAKMYSSSSTPALIHIGKDKSIHSVEIPAPGISDYQRMFPTYVQEKFEFYRFGRAKELSNHIEWRRTHPEEPPLIAFSATPTP